MPALTPTNPQQSFFDRTTFTLLANFQEIHDYLKLLLSNSVNPVWAVITPRVLQVSVSERFGSSSSLLIQNGRKALQLLVISQEGRGMVLRTVSCPLVLECQQMKYLKCLELFSVLTSYFLSALLQLAHIYFSFPNVYIELLRNICIQWGFSCIINIW